MPQRNNNHNQFFTCNQNMCAISLKFKQKTCEKNRTQLFIALIALFHFLLQHLSVAHSMEQMMARKTQMNIVDRTTKQSSPKLLSGSPAAESTTPSAHLRPSIILWQMVEIIHKSGIEDTMIGIESSISTSCRLRRGSNAGNTVCSSHSSFFGGSFGWRDCCWCYCPILDGSMLMNIMMTPLWINHCHARSLFEFMMIMWVLCFILFWTN